LKALELFKSGQEEGIFRTEDVGGKAILRYAAPIHVKESCLQCHVDQGYVPGNVGGCLSVYIPMDNTLSATSRNQSILFGVGAAMGGSLILLLFLATRSLVFKRIDEIKTAMSLMRSTDIGGIPKEHRDELKEIADCCLMFNKKMNNYHRELERRIAEATRDLSETNRNLEAANRKLMVLNKAKSDFFSDISHELRTPLTSIKGAVNLMSRKGSDGEPVYLDIIRRNTDHLMRAVLDFLDYSKIESGQFDLNCREGSLTSVVQDAILSQKLEAQVKSLNVFLDAPGDFVLKFDQDRLYQVITNLLSNAVRFSPDSGTVRLQIKQNDGSIDVSVSDEGPGINPKYHSAIFDKFYQVLENQEEPVHRGTSGIGLAICKNIVEAHGGRIWADSEPRKGSRFVFSIPIRG
jgi:signal transduction histidine kinase